MLISLPSPALCSDMGVYPQSGTATREDRNDAQEKETQVLEIGGMSYRATELTHFILETKDSTGRKL